jgi:RHS repeat-associated protein
MDQLTSYIDPEGNTFCVEYDANGNTVKSIDGRGNSRNMVYDALNRLTDTTDENGGRSITVYDADGRILSFTDAEGAVTGYEYDANGNTTKVTDALGNSTSFTYDAMDRILTSTDSLGAITSYEYTPTGQIKSVTNALGGVYLSEYDILDRLVKEINENGEETTYTYDALGRPLTVTNPLGFTETFEYDSLGRITTVTDMKGKITKYSYDANGNIIETIDALGNSAYYEYDAMNQLIKATLNRIDERHGVDEEQTTLYKYDKRGLTTSVVNAAGNEEIFVYDGNGNLVQKKDQDGYLTNYSYDSRNLVEKINYSDSKEVLFAYNKNGELVTMTDWNGTTNFALDVLGRINSVSDHNDKTTGYSYDAVGNQISVLYPDNTVVGYDYDALGRLTQLNDAEKQVTNYEYDAVGRITKMLYPNGWVESYSYDAVGQLLRQYNEDPSKSAEKSIEHTYEYDANGNVTHEFRAGVGGQTEYDLTRTYDELDRLTRTEGQNTGNYIRIYEYDSLGNLLLEKNAMGNNKGNEYWYNNLNQQVRKQTDGKDFHSYTFDKRGNLVSGTDEIDGSIEESYVYDSTNRMVKGVNGKGEESHYIFNGLGDLVANEWVIEKNSYGYTGVNSSDSERDNGVVVCDRHGNTTGQGHIDSNGQGHTNDDISNNDKLEITPEIPTTPAADNKEFATIHKDYVLDHTSELKNILMEEENGAGGLTYRYTYGLERANVVISGIEGGAGSVKQGDIVKMYYHHDKLGSTDYITNNVDGKVESYVAYDDWGLSEKKPILQMGVRELDLVTAYTGHTYDQVLGQYYARARMYDVADRRFTAIDPVKGKLTDPMTMVQYTYVIDNPLKYTDPTGRSIFGAIVEAIVITVEAVERVISESRESSSSSSSYDSGDSNGYDDNGYGSGGGSLFDGLVDFVNNVVSIVQDPPVVNSLSEVHESRETQLNERNQWFYTASGGRLSIGSTYAGVGGAIPYIDGGFGIPILLPSPPKPPQSVTNTIEEATKRTIDSMFGDTIDMLLLTREVSKQLITQGIRNVGDYLNTPVIQNDPHGLGGTLYPDGTYHLSDGTVYPADQYNILDNAINQARGEKDWRLTGDPGSVNVDGTTETRIGPDGRADKERHNTDHGTPNLHTNPHEHDITWTPEGNPNFGKPQNYPDGAPPFN